MSDSVEDALQEAGAAVRHAVEILRRRPADDVAAKGLVGEFHELRTLMSTTALLMQSFGLSRFPAYSGKERGMLDEADAQLSTAFEHLNQAAGDLTAARQTLDTLF